MANNKSIFPYADRINGWMDGKLRASCTAVNIVLHTVNLL